MSQRAPFRFPDLPTFSDKKSSRKGSLSGTRYNARKGRMRERNAGRYGWYPAPCFARSRRHCVRAFAARHYRGSTQKPRYKCSILRRAAVPLSRETAASHRRNVRCADRGGKRLSSPPRTPRCRRRPAGTSCPRRRRARWRSPPRDFGRRWRWRHGGQGMRCRSV